MLIKSRAIVLRMRKYNDEGRIADLFTEAEGRQSFFVRVSRSPRAAVRPALFQPLSLLHVEWNRREGRRLLRLRSAVQPAPFASLPYHPYKAAMALFVAEFLGHVLREDQEPRLPFLYVSHSVAWLDACAEGFSNFHIVFLLQLSRYLGFYPNLEGGREEGAYFDLLNSCFSRRRPAHPHFLQPDDARWLPLLMRVRYETMGRLRLSGETRSRLLSFIDEYYRLHVPDFPEMKSAQVLQDLFRQGGPA